MRARSAGQAGDVYVLVRIRPHERLVREGDDVYSTVDLTMTEAALGARATIATLEGEEELDFEAGTQPGDRSRSSRPRHARAPGLRPG